MKLFSKDIKKEQVLFYERPFYVFSNFASFQVKYKGVTWMTSEHAYQAMRYEDESLQRKIRHMPSAHEAYKFAMANKDKERKDWKEIKVSVMEEIVRAKLSQHPYIQKQLEETGDREIIEDSPKDLFWGRGPNWKGENHLGKIWMKLREETKSQ